MSREIVMIILVLGGGGLFFAAVWMYLNADDNATAQKRLARVRGELRMSTSTRNASPSLVRQREGSKNVILNRLIKAALPNPEKLRARLTRTGKVIRVGEYLGATAVLIVVVSLAASFIFDLPLFSALACGVGVGIMVPWMIIGNIGDRRIRKFMANFPEAIDTLIRGLRSGLPITESISTVGREMPDPVGTEFRTISDNVRIGQSLDQSMWTVARRLDVPEFRFFIIAIAIQKETGGNLAETLSNLADLLRRRRAMKLKIRAMASEAKASSMIIGSMPFLMFGLMMFVSSEYESQLIHTTPGKHALEGGLTWLSFGVLIMRKMINFDF